VDPIGPDPTEGASIRWVARLVEVLQPLSARAGRLGAMPLFQGFRWAELEVVAPLFEDVEVGRGTRLSVQGNPDRRLWLVVAGEALVSADARPLRVIGPGDAVGVAPMLYSISSPETTIALGGIRALVAGPEQFEELASDNRIRRRLTAVAGDQLRSRRLAKLR
jgi:CRP-like cAMP-binding protein